MHIVLDTISCMAIIGAGLTLGYISCALIYASYPKTIDEPEEKKTTILYKDKYPIDISGNYEESKRMNIRNLNTVHECTPNGGVFLKYNDEEKEFQYWGSSGISYEVLCVVVRKFCLIFNCPNLYVNGFNTTNDEVDVSENSVSISKEDQELFLFKTPAKKPKPKLESEKTTETNEKTDNHKLPILSIKCVGSIDDYDILTGTSKSKVKDDSTEIVSWSSFREIMKKKT